ncbi:MAG: DHA2 family efflux MFS transporter permease subunit [Frankia sp.]|nr:DHA2 family efflux MFS transporter permease subunit [Frankia sp.]
MRTAQDIHDRRWWTLSVLCLSLVLVIVGNTALNVALPTLVREIGATNTELQWMVDAYALVFAGMLFTCGALGDRFGRKGALNVGLLIFGSASVFAAMSDTATGIVVARAVMGLGAALIMPATLSILTNVFPPHERARAIGIWAGLSGAGAAMGPLASGWLLEHFWWGSVFLVNMPVVLLAMGAGRVLVPTSRDPAQPPLDPIGAGLSILGLTSLVYGIIEAPNEGWLSAPTIASFAVAAVILGYFATWELHSTHPMLDLGFFRNRSYTTGSIAITLVFFALFGSFFLMTQYLQLVLGYTPLQAAVRMLVVPPVLMVVAPNSARIVERFGTRRVVASGLVLVSLALAFLSTLDVHTSYLRLATGLIVLGFGMGLSMPPSTAAIMSAVPMGKAGVGSAMNDTTRELGGALGVAVLGSLLASRYTAAVAGVSASLPPQARAVVAKSVGGALSIAGQLGPPGEIIARAARGAYVDSMSTAFIVGAVVAVVAAAYVARFMPERTVVNVPHDLRVATNTLVAAKAEALEP